MEENLSVFLHDHRGEHLDVLLQLCRVPTLATQGAAMREAAGSIEQLLGKNGFQTRLLCVEDAAPVVYGELRGEGNETLLMYNHYDVQPVDPLELWESPPFEPTIRDGKLYARGVGDDKGEIAVRLAAIQTVMAMKGRLPFTIKWIIEGEEEIASPHFEAIVADHTDLLRADACLMEGASVHIPGRIQLGLGSKGLLYVELSVKAIASDAHSKLAAILPSAAWQLLQALSAIRDQDGTVRIPGFYDAVLAPTVDQLKALEDQEDREAFYREAYHVHEFTGGAHGPELRRQLAFSPTCNICGISSGYSGQGVKTVLPAAAMAKLDFRLAPNQDPQEISKNLRAHLTAKGFENVMVEVLASSKPVTTPLNAPIVQRLIRKIQSFSGEAPEITPIGAGSQPVASILNQHLGMHTVGAPGSPVYAGSNLHAPNENILLEDFYRSIEFLTFFFWD